MKLAIIGSRKFTDYDLLCDQISRIYPKVECVISGGAIGADSLAKRWATEK